MSSPSYRHRFEPSLNLFVEQYDGKVHWRDFIESWKAASANPSFVPGMDDLIDLTRAEFDLGYDGMTKFVPASAAAPKETVNRIAILAPRPLQYGLARMYQSLSEESGAYKEMRIFSDLPDARSWLGLPDDFELGN